MSEFSFSKIKETQVFYSVLGINLLLLALVKFCPSMDGPAHLYNSNIIYNLTKGDCHVLSDFFTINKLLIPNWTSHFILSSLYFIFPGWLAEKTLFMLYLIGMAISFRLLLKQLCPSNLYLSIFIFPFMYSFLFHLGFYNYCISFIFFFYTLSYWLEHQNNLNLKKIIVMLLLLALTYFSNALTYCFLGMCLGLYSVALEIIDSKKNTISGPLLKAIAKKLIVLLLISLPSLLMFYLFYKEAPLSTLTNHYSFKELTKWLLNLRALIVYSFSNEQIVTRLLLFLLVFIPCIALFLRIKNYSPFKPFKFLRKEHVILIPILISLISFYTIPNDSNAGMMSDRYCLLFFILTLIWVCSQTIPENVGKAIVVMVITLHFVLLFKHYKGTIRHLSKDAREIEFAGNFIKPGSIVLPVNISDNWLGIHFSNYLGVNKPMIILENYEASIGWFPTKWNYEKMPQIVLGDKISIDGFHWVNTMNNASKKQIDYIFLYGNMSKIAETNHVELQKVLASDFSLVHSSLSRNVNLFKRNLH
jgi:hypothetical protein